MYSYNELSKVSKDLHKYKNIELDSTYKTDLFRSHLNGAIQNLDRASELLGRKNVLSNWNWIPGGEMVALFISLGIVYVFWILRT